MTTEDFKAQRIRELTDMLLDVNLTDARGDAILQEAFKLFEVGPYRKRGAKKIKTTERKVRRGVGSY